MLKAITCASGLLFGIFVTATPMPNPQFQNIQMMQIQQQLNVRNELNTSIQKRLDLQEKAKEIESALALTKTFFMKSKTEKLLLEKKHVQNDLMNIEIQINELNKLSKQ